MSGYTEILNLFKYNTSTDGNNKFNIDLSLNDNFDKIDEFAGNVGNALDLKQDKKTAVKYEYNTAVGTATNPVYVDINGNVQPCSKTIEDTRFDGQWVSSYHVLNTATTAGEFNSNLSYYLPSDSFNYLCQFSLNVYDYGETNGKIYFQTDIYQEYNVYLLNKLYVSQGNQYARHNSNIFTMPVGQGRLIAWKCTDANTTREIALVGYRRLGTNS